MTTPSAPPSSTTPSEQAPTRALAFGVIWLVAAAISAGGSVWVAINLTSSAALRIIIALLLVAFSTAALMLASDSVERWLAGEDKGWARWLEWLATSVVALAVVVIVGAPVTSVAPDRPGAWNVVIDFVIDAVLGAVGGALAVLLIFGATAALGEAIWWVQSRLGVQNRAERWQRLPHPGRRLVHDLIRGVLLGAAGLLLSALCTAVITTVTANPTGAVDTPVRHETSVLLTVFLPVLFWLVGTGAVWLLLARRRDGELKPRGRVRHGTHASALSVFLLILAAWIAAAGVESHARDELSSGAAGAVPTVSLTTQQANSSSPYLAQQFEPQLRLTTGEHWDPTSVTWYVKQNPRPNTDAPFCNAHGAGQPPAGCYQIPSCDEADPGQCAPSGSNDPALYYRYVDANNAGSRHPPRDAGGGAWILIQYWIFYNYDSLQTWPVTQWHQSDWEQVSVLVARHGSVVRPVEVAFSEHCYGALVPAERVRWINGSHPVVYVGRGSHANYPRPVSLPVRQLRCSLGVTPRYLGVAGLFFSPAVDGSRVEIPLTYLIGLRDDADGTRPVPTPRLVWLDTAHDIRSFRGYWGLDNNLSPLQTFRQRVSAGPQAPQLQGAWAAPFPNMLCNNRWLSTRSIPRSETAWICSSN